MGTLNLPASGSVYVDTNVIIYTVEKIDPYRAILQALWQASRKGQFKIVSSELTILETLVKPRKENNSVLESAFRQVLFASHELQLVPVSASILDMAASLRADFGVKPPDAIHAATAISLSCKLFVTNDPFFKRIGGLQTAVLSDVL